MSDEAATGIYVDLDYKGGVEMLITPANEAEFRLSMGADAARKLGELLFKAGCDAEAAAAET